MHPLGRVHNIRPHVENCFRIWNLRSIDSVQLNLKKWKSLWIILSTISSVLNSSMNVWSLAFYSLILYCKLTRGPPWTKSALCPCHWVWGPFFFRPLCNIYQTFRCSELHSDVYVVSFVLYVRCWTWFADKSIIWEPLMTYVHILLPPSYEILYFE